MKLLDSEKVYRYIEKTSLIPNHAKGAVFLDLEESCEYEGIVHCRDCEHNNHCLTQEFVEEESRIPFDRDKWFCADGVKREEG